MMTSASTKTGTGQKPKGKRANRVIHPVEFKPEHIGPLQKAAAVAGIPFGTWVRQAALEKAAKLGFWDPFREGGPKKEENSD